MLLRRLFAFLLLQAAAVALGWYLAGAVGSLILGTTASLAWLAIDLLRGGRLLHWLRHSETATAPSLAGVWGEAAERTRRALRSREQQARESEARLQEFLAAIQASPSGVVLLDARGHIEWCNQTAAEQFGFDAQRDVQQQVGNLVRDPAFAAYYASGDYTGAIAITGRDDTPARPVKLSVQLHPYGAGHKLLLSRDITALEQADAMRRDFVANVSHEIRTPLTVLNGFVETLQTLPLDERERARYLELMSQQAHRMQTLVSDLLTLSRLEGSPAPGIAEWVPIAGLMAQCEQEARALSRMLDAPGGSSHDLVFETLIGGEIAGSQGELLSAMSNLTSNAIRYTPPGGRIHVVFGALADGRAEFSVKDSGQGIAAEHLPRLTERFYRVDRSRSRESGGTGLGLAIVKHVAQRHGAELRIDSEVGVGSTFSIAFPAVRVRAMAPERRLPATEEVS
jgi:two-component system, OmpR family, phosphate regulon sensor histidine kinase PhoR